MTRKMTTFGLVWLLISPAVSAGQCEEVPGHPLDRDKGWVLIAHRMLVEGVPLPFGAGGGGVGHPEVAVRNAGCALDIDIESLGVRFDYLGTEFADVERWMRRHAKETEKKEHPKLGKAPKVIDQEGNERPYSRWRDGHRFDPAADALQRAEGWLTQGSLEGANLGSSRFQEAVDEAIAGDPDAQAKLEQATALVAKLHQAVAGEVTGYYAGTLKDEPGIFWILAVKSPRLLRSIHGFTAASTGNIEAPAHLQKHLWIYYPNFSLKRKDQPKKDDQVEALLDHERVRDLLLTVLAGEDFVKSESWGELPDQNEMGYESTPPAEDQESAPAGDDQPLERFDQP